MTSVGEQNAILFELKRLRQQRDYFISLANRFRGLDRPELAESMYRMADFADNARRPLMRSALGGVTHLAGEISQSRIRDFGTDPGFGTRTLGRPVPGGTGIIPTREILGSLGEEPVAMQALPDVVDDASATRRWMAEVSIADQPVVAGQTREVIARQLSRNAGLDIPLSGVEDYLGLDKPGYVNPNAPTGRRLGPNPGTSTPYNSNIETVLRKPLQLQIPQPQRSVVIAADDLTTNRFWNQFGALEPGGAATVPRNPPPRSPAIGELPRGSGTSFSPSQPAFSAGNPPRIVRKGQQLLSDPPEWGSFVEEPWLAPEPGGHAPANKFHAGTTFGDVPVDTPSQPVKDRWRMLQEKTPSTAFKESFSSREVGRMREAFFASTQRAASAEALGQSGSRALQQSNYGPYLRGVMSGGIEASAGSGFGPKWLLQLAPKIEKFVQSFGTRALQTMLKMPK